MNTDHFSGTRLTVVDEDVRLSISIVIHQIAGLWLESHIAAVITYTGKLAIIIPLSPVRMNTDHFSGTRLTVVDEDIRLSIGIVIH